MTCLLCVAGAWFFWPRPASLRTKPPALQKVAAPAITTLHSASTAPSFLTAASTNAAPAVSNVFTYRLCNTSEPLQQLMHNSHAILLENAFIDTSRPLNLAIPKHLQAAGDPGAYIVQARGPIDEAFRAMLASAGAQVVSYIPNDAYLVRVAGGVAKGLAANAQVQAVIPYEPYYKIQSGLLASAVADEPLKPGVELNLGLFGDDAAATLAKIQKLGATILAQSRSPFGPLVKVQAVGDWTALVKLAGVQRVEVAHRRVKANDLSRATLGVAADTQVSSNYMNLSGSNVMERTQLNLAT